ncbi:DUF3592 domain-containing protein [Pseudomonas sp. NUPR-001]|uniref:DUF3592 domain-containing protein n=1 Tax=Pseudomonas sp. NUPR-001 TaxID=3416058 RepID=UPI003F9B2C6F
MKAIGIIKCSFLAIGALLLLGAGVSYKSTDEFLAKAESATGSVVALLNNQGGYAPVIAYVDREGKPFELISSFSSNPPAYSVGDRVEVVYSAGAPADGKIAGITVWLATIILAALGAVLLAVGIIMVLMGRRKSRKQADLRKHGQLVKADIQSVETNPRFAINGQHPYMIRSQWLNPRTSKVHVFESDNIWFDPSGYLKDQSISVFVDSKDPTRYHVDISFLPGSAV